MYEDYKRGNASGCRAMKRDCETGSEIMKHVKEFATESLDIYATDRELSSDSLEKSGYIKQVLEENKIAYRTENTPYKDENIIVPFKGKSNDELIICCHHDRMPATPGADDPYSATAVLLELAKELKKWQYTKPRKFRKNIKLISFGAEENVSLLSKRTGCLGSAYYAKNNDLSDVEYVVFLDILGREKQLATVVKDGFGENSSELNALLSEAGEEVGVNIGKTNIPQSYGDYINFKQSAKTAWLTRMDQGNYTWKIYHSEKDKADTINPSYLEEAKRVMVEFIERYLDD
ncbi:MAG: M28 family peptidase [Candidatus Aenigmarchaeota archaeon]|nr:M28 family peptidase [Candidatus Aenigmarchaeota archaeon]